METIFTLTLRTLQQNKKRAFLTIFTIILTVGMMTAVLCGGWSMLRFLQEKEAVYGGDYAYRIELTSQQQAETLMQGKNIENVSLLRFAGSSFYGDPSIKNLLVCFKPFTFGILKTKALFLKKSQSALYSTK